MLKRGFDLLASLIGLILLSPILFIISLFLFIFQGGPVFFRQSRLGKKGREFEIFKFRTMEMGESHSSAHDEKRITRLGKILRKTSLDELPVLVNVVKGDMSLVGPRPLLIKYKDRFNTEQFRRHDVVPGITGLAQVKGRNTLSWEEKFEYDTYYVDHRSFYIDLKILIITLWQVFHRKGVSPDGADIMPEFMGTEKHAVAEED